MYYESIQEQMAKDRNYRMNKAANKSHSSSGGLSNTNAGGVSCGGSDGVGRKEHNSWNDLSGYGKRWGRVTWLQTRLPLWTQLFTGSPPLLWKQWNPASMLYCTPSPVPTQSFKDGATLENVVPFGSVLNSFFFLPMRCLLSLLLSFAQSPWFSPFVLPAFLGYLGLLLSVFVLNGFYICASVTLFSE